MPDLKLSLDSGDATKKTVKADWTFNAALDGVSQSAIRIDWGDGTVDMVASGTTTKSHAYAATYEQMRLVKLIGNDVTETERINIMPGVSPPFYNPDLGNVHTVSPMKDQYDKALEEAEKVLPQTSPWIGADNVGGLKPVGR